MFDTQQEIWIHVSGGGSVFLGETEIKFIGGSLQAKENNGWRFCPVSFENPKLFKRISK